MEAFTAEHYVLAVKLRRDKVSSFDEYPFSLPVVRHLETLELHPAARENTRLDPCSTSGSAPELIRLVTLQIHQRLRVYYLHQSRQLASYHLQLITGKELGTQPRSFIDLTTCIVQRSSESFFTLPIQPDYLLYNNCCAS
jgi:hypothetical protein